MVTFIFPLMWPSRIFIVIAPTQPQHNITLKRTSVGHKSYFANLSTPTNPAHSNSTVAPRSPKAEY